MSMSNITPLTEEERNVWTEVYRFYERWHDIDGDPDKWLALAEDSGRVYARLNNHLASGLLAAVIDELSERVKEQETGVLRDPNQTVMMIDGKPVTF